MELITEKYQELSALSEAHHVDELYVFGSVVTEKSFSDHSDIDFLVQFQEMDIEGYFENYVSLKSELKKLFLREVDLVEVQTIKNPILKKSIERTKKKIYGRADSEVAV